MQIVTVTITLDLSATIIEELRAKALQNGQTLEAYLERLVEQEARKNQALSAAPEAVTPKERALTAVYAVLTRRFQSGQLDVAERHDEHQP